MTEYRVDYVLTSGERGVWHYEREGTLDEMKSQCRSEYPYIRDTIHHRHGNELRELVIVEVTERDAEVVKDER